MTRKPITRRRFMHAFAVAGTFAALPFSNVMAAAPIHHWRGILFGAQVNLSIAHPEKKEAERLFNLCVQESKRLENIFTLYDQHSELSLLNKKGRLENPSPEMIDLLQRAKAYYTLTNGAFDVTMKPLEENEKPELVGMQNVSIEPTAIHFAKPGMAITLNGIAQGYITDRITHLLRTENLNNVLVELGEKNTIGGHPSGTPWRLALSDGKEIVDIIEIRDQALATSAPINGLYDPRTGQRVSKYKTLSVISTTACEADALSTALSVMDIKEHQNITDKKPDIRVIKTLA